MLLHFGGMRYRLKDGTEPVHGHATYGTEGLCILAIDTDDMTVLVKPAEFSSRAKFWAAIHDLEEEN